MRHWPRCRDGEAVILLAHEPDIMVRVPERVALVLSGHTHGGQVRLFGWSPVVPSRYGNRFAYGHVREQCDFIVSGGLGCSIAPFRFGVAPEIVLRDRGMTAHERTDPHRGGADPRCGRPRAAGAQARHRCVHAAGRQARSGRGRRDGARARARRGTRLPRGAGFGVARSACSIAQAANEPDRRVHAAVYAVDVAGSVAPRAEIEEVIWIDPSAPPDIHARAADARPRVAAGAQR